jgi:glycerol kinase
VAYLAGLRLGVYESLEKLSDNWQCEKRFNPEMSKETRDKFYLEWRQAVRRVQCQ